MERIGILEDLCPCGSGNKLTKCCLPKALGLSTANLPATDLKLLRKYFGNYSKKELIATLGGLHLFPENQSHTIRLEVASRIANNLAESRYKEIISKRLKSELNRCLPTLGEIGLMEDPPESLFTENILFHGGNYVVYSGNSISENFALSIFFESISQNRGIFPSDFVLKIEGSSLALLTISDEISRRMNHTRNIETLATWRKGIFLPSDDQVKKAKSAVTFTKTDIDELFSLYGFDSTILNPFILHEKNTAFVENDFQNNLLQIKPLVQIDKGIMVLSPSSIISAIHNFIISISKERNLNCQFIEKYKETLWEHVQHYFDILFFSPSKLDLPQLEENVSIKEAIYTIDYDKVAYVQLIVGNPIIASEINLEDGRTTRIQKAISERDKRVTEWLFNTYGLDENNILHVKVLNAIEGVSTFIFEINSKQLELLMSVEDLKIISELAEFDGLTLWKYAKAAKEVTLSPLNSFLDSFSVYYKNSYSFHLAKHKRNKTEKPVISLLPGSGIDLKSKTIRTLDRHGALIGNPAHYTSVIRRHTNDKIPIYTPDSSLRGEFYQLIEEYNQPIWICPSSKYVNNAINYEFHVLLSQFIDTIAYWVWQLTPSLEHHLAPLGNKPISIEVFVEESSKWYSFEDTEGETNDLDLDFKWKIDNYKIELFIPYSINRLLMKPHNLGERLMLDALMCAFGEMLELAKLTNTLNDSERYIILDKHAPLGSKKKIFSVNSGKHASLDKRFMPNLRTIQDHDVQEQMDWLANILSEKLKINDTYKTKKECTEICNIIVDEYSKKLKVKLSFYHWQDLLQHLILLNEAVCHHRAFNYLMTTTTIQCFKDIKSLVDSNLENVSDLNATALALRTLIEIVAAEPPTGNREISLCEMDELIAISHQLIDWAMISDLIHQEILDFQLHVLESGRIIIKHNSGKTILNSLKKSKLLESYEFAVSDFEDYFTQEIPDPSDNFNEYEIAFKAEFGLSVSELKNIVGLLVDLGFEQQSSSPKLHLSELKTRIKNDLNWNEDLILNAINLLSLKKRILWEKPPVGYNQSDVWPWKYNRRLSYVRKPIIIGLEPKEDPLVFWGTRHVEEAWRYLTNLVFSGRYKINHEGCTGEMKKLVGSIINKNGKYFTLAVKEWFTENTDLMTDSEVPIRPKEIFNSALDLGDIDVLAIDREHNHIYLIECKCINFGRNAQEIANEIERFLGATETESSWVEKHLKREDWIRTNIKSVIQKYKLKDEVFSITALFLISSDIPIRHICKIPMPFVTYPQLIREGISALPK